MSDKVKRYGIEKLVCGAMNRLEWATEAERDRENNNAGWRKYTVTRTVRAKGRPLWWAIRQLQEGRAVVDAEGDAYAPSELPFVLRASGRSPELPAWAQSWTLAEVQP